MLDHTLKVIRSFGQLIEDDCAFFLGCNGLREETYTRIRYLADAIFRNDRLRELFYLVLYIHDFGKVISNGPGHQEAGVPVAEAILTELGYKSEEIAWAAQLVRLHTVPGEAYIGELALTSLAGLLDIPSPFPAVSFLQALVLLNICDINGLKGGESLYEDNAAFFVALTDEQYVRELVQDAYRDRLYRICAAAFPKRTDPATKARLLERTQERFRELEEIFARYPEGLLTKVRRLLTEVDFQYTASLFPAMTSEGIAVFLRLSAGACFPETGDTCSKLVNTDDRLGRELDRCLHSAQADEAIRSLIHKRDCVLYWETVRLRDNRI